MNKGNIDNFEYLFEGNNKFAYPDNTRYPEKYKSKLLNFVKLTNKVSSSEMTLSEKNKQNQLNLNELLFDDKNIKNSFQYPLTSRNIKQVINQIDDMYGDYDFMWRYFLLYYAGFYFSILKPASFSPESLQLPNQFKAEKQELINKLKSKEISDLEFQEEITKLSKKVVNFLNEEHVSLMDFINSGAKGDVRNMQEILVGIGLSINSKGEIIDVIDNSLSEGLTQTQFFNNSSQGIQTLYAKSTDTAKPGYLGRKLETVTEGVKLSATKDCGTKKYLTIEVKDKDVLESIKGRHIVGVGGSISYVDSKNLKLIGKTLKLRDPLFCLAEDGICQNCYNDTFVKNMKLKPGSNIGLIASSGLLGGLVNLTLKGSHTGVSLNQEEINFDKDLENYM